MEKCGRQKVPIKFFLCCKTQSKLVAGWKILLANFSFKDQSEENAFGAAMMIFPLTNKIINTLIIYKPASVKPLRMNQISSQLYTFSFLYVLVKNIQLKNCCLVLCPKFNTIFSFVLCQDDRRIAMLLSPGHNHEAFLVPVP